MVGLMFVCYFAFHSNFQIWSADRFSIQFASKVSQHSIGRTQLYAGHTYDAYIFNQRILQGQAGKKFSEIFQISADRFRI